MNVKIHFWPFSAAFRNKFVSYLKSFVIRVYKYRYTYMHRAHSQNKTPATKFSGQKLGLNQQQQQQQSQTICLQNRSMCYFVYERVCVCVYNQLYWKF